MYITDRTMYTTDRVVRTTDKVVSTTARVDVTIDSVHVYNWKVQLTEYYVASDRLVRTQVAQTHYESPEQHYPT